MREVSIGLFFQGTNDAHIYRYKSSGRCRGFVASGVLSD